MRVVTKTEQEEASAYAMKGFAVGGLKWGIVGLCVSGLLHVYVPWYRATRIPNKFYIVMAFALGGGAHSSDRYLVQYERRGRKEQLERTRRERWETLYAKPSQENKIPIGGTESASQ